MCNHQKYILKFCPGGLHWDKNDRNCNLPEKAQCHKSFIVKNKVTSRTASQARSPKSNHQDYYDDEYYDDDYNDSDYYEDDYITHNTV